MHRHWPLLLTLIAGAFLGLVSPHKRPGLAQVAPLFTPGACSFTPPSGSPQIGGVRCGTVQVPENRGRAGSRPISLAVAVVKTTTQPATLPPLVYLSGGPGAGGIREGLSLVVLNAGGRFPQADRDVVLFDQRGTGSSTPPLACPEIVAADEANVLAGMGIDDLVQRETAGAVACHDRLVGDGIELAAYNSATTAADVNDIRVALGYPQISLWGISYGTRIALEVLRDFPSTINGAVIDGVLPPQVNLPVDQVPDANRAFSVLFDRCAADAACSTAFPDLAREFYALVRRLNDSPGTFRFLLRSQARAADAPFTGDTLLQLTFSALYSTRTIPELPALIYAVRAGDFTEAAFLAQTFLVTYDVNWGAFLSSHCAEYELHSSQAAVTAALLDLPAELQHSILRPDDGFSMCAAWGIPPAPAALTAPVASDVPVLLLSGEFDPITPPAYGDLAGQSLSHHYSFQFPGVGHGTGISGACGYNVVATFLADPTVAPVASPMIAACVAAQAEPRWTPPLL